MAVELETRFARLKADVEESCACCQQELAEYRDFVLGDCVCNDCARHSLGGSDEWYNSPNVVLEAPLTTALIAL